MPIFELAALAAFTITLLTIAWHDAETLRIPDNYLIPGAALVGLLLVSASLANSDWYALNQGLLGATASAAVYLVLHLITRGGLGFGDVKLGALIGLVVGWLNPGLVIPAIIAAFGLAGVGGIVLIATRHFSKHTAIPLAPFMALAALAALPSEILSALRSL